MATFSKVLLSGSTQGKAIKVAATTSTGTTIHATGTSSSVIDEVWLYAYNSSASAVVLTIQYGGTTAVDNDIKLTIIAQDPYINEESNKHQAMGLCFSVPRVHKKIPPSLKNIRKEIKNCYPDYNIPSHGLLKRWARKEKMLLLNFIPLLVVLC